MQGADLWGEWSQLLLCCFKGDVFSGTILKEPRVLKLCHNLSSLWSAFLAGHTEINSEVHHRLLPLCQVIFASC